MAPDLRQASAGTTWLLVAEEPKSTQVKLAQEGGRIGGVAGSHVVNAKADAQLVKVYPAARLADRKKRGSTPRTRELAGRQLKKQAGDQHRPPHASLSAHRPMSDMDKAERKPRSGLVVGQCGRQQQGSSPSRGARS